MPVFPDESAPIVRFVRKIRHFPGQKTVLLLSHDVNGLPVSLTSYANFVVNEFFSVTVVNEMQVLLTTHESTNFQPSFSVDPICVQIKRHHSLITKQRQCIIAPSLFRTPRGRRPLKSVHHPLLITYAPQMRL